MSGKIASIAILLCALIAGGALYYLQIYGFYKDVSSEVVDIGLLPIGEQTASPIPTTGISAIDADSSPIRFRACFETSEILPDLKAEYQVVTGVDPRNAPGWFACFDARAIATELNAGTAVTFLGQKNIDFGVDRIVAITDDGRGYVWHELNDCGEKAYDGTIVGEECPRRPEAGQ